MHGFHRFNAEVINNIVLVNLVGHTSVKSVAQSLWKSTRPRGPVNFIVSWVNVSVSLRRSHSTTLQGLVAVQYPSYVAVGFKGTRCLVGGDKLQRQSHLQEHGKRKGIAEVDPAAVMVREPLVDPFTYPGVPHCGDETRQPTMVLEKIVLRLGLGWIT